MRSEGCSYELEEALQKRSCYILLVLQYVHWMLQLSESGP